MRFAKWHAAQHEIVGKICRSHEGIRCRLKHSLSSDFYSTDRQAKHAERGSYILKRRKECFLVFLKILVVSRRQALKDGKEPRKQTRSHRCFGPDQFKAIRIFLLRHQATA